MAELFFNETEKESFNKKPVPDLSRIVLGRGYIIKAGEIVGYEIKGKKGKYRSDPRSGISEETLREVKSPSS